MNELACEKEEVGNVWGGRFEIRRKLGSGGLGAVYEAFDRVRRELVAVKTVLNLDAHRLYSFKKEFRSLAEIRHPNLVRLGELIHDGERWFFTMELLGGEDFIEYVRPGWIFGQASSGVLDEERLRDATRQLVEGLLALQRLGLVHRDIKPSNIMVTEEGRVVILDFGLVTQLADDEFLSSIQDAVVGTVLFMSPEQAQSLPVGPASDWYSVGVLLYLALSGEFPFDGAAIQILYAKVMGEPVPVLDRAPAAPEDLAQLCMELLAVDPEKRPAGQAIGRQLGIEDSRVEVQGAHRGRTAAEEFVGRVEELGILNQALEEGATRGLTAAFVVGIAGVGKSMLVRRFLADAQGRDLLALSGRCFDRESVPYNGFDGVIDTLSRYLASLPPAEVEEIMPEQAGLLVRLFPVLGRVDALAKRADIVADGENSLLRIEAYDALGELLRNLAIRRRIAIFIDDLHWADDETLRLLGHLSLLAEDAPLFVIATIRRSEDGTYGEHNEDWLARMVDFTGGARVLEVKNLPEDDTRKLVETLWSEEEEPDSSSVQRLVADTKGHPMMLDELIRYRRTSKAGTPARGLQLADVILNRVRQLSGLQRKILEVICVSGIPVQVGLLEAVLAAGPSEIYEALDSLQIDRFLNIEHRQNTSFASVYHGRIREAVVGKLDEVRQRELHAQLADIYLADAEEKFLADPLVLVDHLESAGRIELAASHAEKAAEKAARSFAFERAARLYRRALARADEDRREGLRIAMADMLLTSGRTIEAAEVYLQVASENEDKRLQRRLRRQAAEAYLVNGDVVRGLRLLESVLEDCGLAISTSKMGLVLSTLWHNTALKRRGLAFVPRSVESLSADEAERLELFSAASRQMSFLDPIIGFNFRVRTLRLALDLGQRPATVEGVALQAVAESARGGEDARERAEELLTTARQIAVSDAHRAVIAGCQASATIFSGDSALALEELEDSANRLLSHATGPQRVAGLNRVRIWQTKALLDLGQLAELRQLYDRLADRAANHGDHLQEMSLARIAGVVWMFSGDLARLERELGATELYEPLATAAILHWYDLRTRGEISLYRGTVEADYEWIDAGFDDVGKSLFARRFQLARIEVCWWRGRILLALLAQGSAGKKERSDLVQKIRRLRTEEDTGLAALFADMLEAGLHQVEGEEEKALACLDDVARDADARKAMLYAACARLHANMIRDSTVGPQASTYFEEQGVAEPHRTASVYLPGFQWTP